jgi:hypothetical protein
MAAKDNEAAIIAMENAMDCHHPFTIAEDVPVSEKIEAKQLLRAVESERDAANTALAKFTAGRTKLYFNADGLTAWDRNDIGLGSQ